MSEIDLENVVRPIAFFVLFDAGVKRSAIRRKDQAVGHRRRFEGVLETMGSRIDDANRAIVAMGHVDFFALGVIEHSDRVWRSDTIDQLAGVQPHHQHIAGVGIGDISDSGGAVQGDIEEIVLSVSRIDLHAGN